MAPEKKNNSLSCVAFWIWDFFPISIVLSRMTNLAMFFLLLNPFERIVSEDNVRNILRCEMGLREVGDFIFFLNAHFQCRLNPTAMLNSLVFLPYICVTLQTRIFFQSVKEKCAILVSQRDATTVCMNSNRLT